MSRNIFPLRVRAGTAERAMGMGTDRASGGGGNRMADTGLTASGDLCAGADVAPRPTENNSANSRPQHCGEVRVTAQSGAWKATPVAPLRVLI